MRKPFITPCGWPITLPFIAQTTSLSLEARENAFFWLTPLHDIGKVGIPDVILSKPGKLTKEEFAIVKTHTTIGAEILAGGESEINRSGSPDLP